MKQRSIFFLSTAVTLISFLTSALAEKTSLGPDLSLLMDKSATQTALQPDLRSKKKQVEQFLDTTLKQALKKYHIPGVMMSVTQGDQVLYAKGLGLANTGTKQKMTADRTLFRIGSLSKLATATVAMLLVQQGKLKLSQDITGYLPTINIRKRFQRPLTLHHLLTHTSGFDVTDIFDASKKSSGLQSLTFYLNNHMTPQLYPPGKYLTYTNHGLTLVGAIIESLEKKPFHQAMKERLFAPLGMHRSSFKQPLEPKLQAMLATGHRYSLRTKQYHPLPLDYSLVSPADAMVTTAKDMAAFLMLHANGSVGGNALLKPSTLQTMHKTHFRYAPALEGWAYGFWEERHAIGGKTNQYLRGVAHTGGQLGFTSYMFVHPASKLGVFICTNRRYSKMRSDVVKAFLEKFYPHKKQKPRQTKTAPQKIRYAGHYKRIGLTQHGIEKVAYLLSPSFVASITRDKKKELHSSLHGPLLFEGKQIFRRKRKGTPLVFRVNKRGIATHFYSSTVAYERLARWQQPELHRKIVFFLLLFFGLSIFVWLLQGWRTKKTTAFVKLSKLVLTVTSLLNIGLSVWLVFEVKRVAGIGWDYGLYASTKLLLQSFYLSFNATLAMAVFTFTLWKRKEMNLFWRFYYTLLWLGSVLFLAIFRHWGLLTF